jgi:hypothetical protein
MSGKWTVIALGIVLLGLVLAGFTPLTAQPGLRMPMQPEHVGRYTVVKVVESAGTMNILLLDTVTGDLYRATADDAKPYRERPKHGGVIIIPFDPFDKDFGKDKDKDFNPFKDAKDLPKDFGKDKDLPFKDFRKDKDFKIADKDLKFPTDKDFKFPVDKDFNPFKDLKDLPKDFPVKDIRDLRKDGDRKLDKDYFPKDGFKDKFED